MNEESRRLAERVRTACVRAALEAYQDAGVSGLCAEGRWEYTIGVLREMNLESLLAQAGPDAMGQGNGRSDSG
ncbi:MAG: acetyltransferase [Candidatus Competibacter sp.]